MSALVDDVCSFCRRQPYRSKMDLQRSNVLCVARVKFDELPLVLGAIIDDEMDLLLCFVPVSSPEVAADFQSVADRDMFHSNNKMCLIDSHCCSDEQNLVDLDTKLYRKVEESKWSSPRLWPLARLLL
jgi:hypothetical protein